MQSVMPHYTHILKDPEVEACLKGQRGAHSAVYNRYSRAMYNLAYRMVNNREDAEDILQESFTDCFRKIASFRYDSTFGAWLKKIVINNSLNFIRRRKIELSFDEIPESYLYFTEQDEEKTIYDVRNIVKAIEHLPNGYRVVLTLYLLEGYDHQEISEILGISESTSKTQYLRAKAKLRSLIKDEPWKD